MKKIENLFIIESYYNELNMQKIFINDMKKHMKLLKFDKHEYLSREDENLEYLLFFIQGKAKVFKTLPNGRNLLLAFYKPFRIIGDIEIIKSQLKGQKMCNKNKVAWLQKIVQIHKFGVK